jgi:hypothetical protein
MRWDVNAASRCLVAPHIKVLPCKLVFATNLMLACEYHSQQRPFLRR